MNDSKISVRYAKALFESAAENGLLDRVREDMEKVQKVCVIPEFQYLVETPVMKGSQKCSVLDKILKKEVDSLTLSMLNLIFKNGREQFIPAIARNYIELYKKEKGIRSASIISAGPITDALKSKVEKIITGALNTSIELESGTDPDLIGGFVIRIEDQQYDASVATSLKKMRKQLLN